MPLLYAHLVGGQDELVFDGASFAVDAQRARRRARAPSFERGCCASTSTPTARPCAASCHRTPALEAQAWQALVTGVRDYVGKNGFPGAIIGLSGGIDSALVLAIAVDALGADRVRTVMMPSPYTADISWIDAREMAQRLGVRYDEIADRADVRRLPRRAGRASSPACPRTPPRRTSRRASAARLLMALSNKIGSIVLTTGNKSEMAIGYCTLYGDMAGGFAVIKDVAKTLVYRLARLEEPQPTGAPMARSGR